MSVYTEQSGEVNRRRPAVDCRIKAGRASDYLHYLPDLPEEGRKLVVLYCRVSSPEQERDGNLSDQEDEAIQQLRTMGIRRGHGLVGVVSGVESSRIQDSRPLLERAIAEARKRGAILVTMHRDRLLRSRHFDGTNETEAPTIADYVQLRRMAGDVSLASIRDPDQPARSDQVKRGQQAKGNRGGRPLKAEHRVLLDAVWNKWRALAY